MSAIEGVRVTVTMEVIYNNPTYAILAILVR